MIKGNREINREILNRINECFEEKELYNVIAVQIKGTKVKEFLKKEIELINKKVEVLSESLVLEGE